MKDTLIYGYGNIGRQDDGLGILLVEKWERWSKKHGLLHLDFDYNFQLNIEDADTISRYKKVIFVDASIEKDNKDVKLNPVEPTGQTEFTMHAMHPGFILHLCNCLYDKYPEVCLLSIRGYEFEFEAPLSSRAERNLDLALGFALEVLTIPRPEMAMAYLERLL